MCVTIRIDESALFAGRVMLAYACVRGVTVIRGSPESDRILKETEEKVRRTYDIEKLRKDPVVKALRKFYWKLGIDPTKQRPASEALVRRVLRGRSLPRINNVVDAGNAVSLLTLVPIGIYDLGHVRGSLVLRAAREGEEFRPIGGEPERLTSRQIVLADEEKVLHVFPYRDSVLTMVRNDTIDVLIVACGVEGMNPDLVVEAAHRTAELVTQLAGGEAGEVLKAGEL